MRQCAVLFGALALASAAQAIALPSAGKFACTLIGQGSCTSGPNGICLGNRVTPGPARVFLQLDFERETATLNRIRGRIIPGAAPGSSTLVWDDFAVMGETSFSFSRLENGRTLATLARDGRTVTFACRAVG